MADASTICRFRCRFSLSGSDNVLPNGDKIFNIDPKTGQVTVSGQKALDFERINLYELTLNVADGGGLSASNDLTINIIDVYVCCCCAALPLRCEST